MIHKMSRLPQLIITIGEEEVPWMGDKIFLPIKMSRPDEQINFWGFSYLEN